MNKFLKPHKARFDYKNLKIGDRVSYEFWDKNKWEERAYTIIKILDEEYIISQCGIREKFNKSCFNNPYFFLLERKPKTGFGGFINKIENYGK